MTTRTIRATLIASVMLAAGAAFAQQGALVNEGFEDGVGEFVTLDGSATLGVTLEEGEVYGGRGSLQLGYTQRTFGPGMSPRDMPGTLVLPLAQPLPRLEGLSFAIWSAESTAMMVMLAERDDGPRYNCFVWCEAGAWHEIELGLDDFVLDQDGPDDPDGELEPEMIGGVGFVDVSSFLRHLAEQTPLIHSEPETDQILRLDDLKLLATSPVRSDPGEGIVLIADYEQPTGFVMIGGEDLVVADEDAGDGSRALTVTYDLSPRTLVGVVHQVRPGTLAGVSELRLRVRCTAETTLIVTVEEQRGQDATVKAEYMTIVQVAAFEPWREVVIPVEDLTPTDQCNDPNGQLDIELVGTIVVADATALVVNEAVTNNLSLDEFVGIE